MNKSYSRLMLVSSNNILKIRQLILIPYEKFAHSMLLQELTNNTVAFITILSTPKSITFHSTNE